MYGETPEQMQTAVTDVHRGHRQAVQPGSYAIVPDSALAATDTVGQFERRHPSCPDRTKGTLRGASNGLGIRP